MTYRLYVGYFAIYATRTVVDFSDTGVNEDADQSIGTQNKMLGTPEDAVNQQRQLYGSRINPSIF
jgi:hypothetical protein